MPVSLPGYARNHLPTISPWSWESIGAFLTGAAIGGSTTTAFPAANVAILIPFQTWQVLPIKAVGWDNGITSGSNIDIGIFDSLGTTLLTSLGGVTRGTAAQYNSAALVYTLPVGSYYMALSCDGTPNFIAEAPAAGLLQAAGVLEIASGQYPLASSGTPVQTTRAFIPRIVLMLDATALQ